MHPLVPYLLLQTNKITNPEWAGTEWAGTVYSENMDWTDLCPYFIQHCVGQNKKGQHQMLVLHHFHHP